MGKHPNPFFDKLEGSLEGFFPFTPLNIIWLNLKKGTRSILDVGCGKGYQSKFINRAGSFRLVCCDIFEPYLSESKKRNISANGFTLCDARRLPFKNKSFDTVLCIRVLEHLKKNEGKELIENLEKIAIKQVIIFTPATSYPHEPYDENPYQLHQVIWNPIELESLGYKTVGNGLPFLLSDIGLAVRFPIFRPFFLFLWIISGPFVYWFPKLAAHVVCIKDIAHVKDNINET